MATTETRIDRGDYEDVRRVVTDDATGAVVATLDSIEWKPGTAEHDEPINREALADKLHLTLSRIATRDDLDRDVRDALLLIHRFLHDDMTDAEV